MIQWDFGITNAIAKELGMSLFPFSAPPSEQRTSPYLILDLKSIVQGKNLISRAEFTITIASDGEISGKSYDILRNLNKLTAKELTLYQEKEIIGSAKFKIFSIESKKNNLILNMIALLQLKAIYSDAEVVD